jgi:hypothetical protein
MQWIDLAVCLATVVSLLMYFCLLVFLVERGYFERGGDRLGVGLK